MTERQSWLPLTDVIGGLAGLSDSPYPEVYQAMVRSVLGPAAEAPVELREQVIRRSIDLHVGEPGESLSDDIDGWVTKVALHAYQTTDEDVEALKECSEAVIYEITVAAGLGAVLVRLEAAERAFAGTD